MNNYNPYDILKKDAARNHLQTSIRSFTDDKFLSIDRETIESMVSGSIFWECVGGTGIWYTAVDFVGKKTIINNLRTYQCEQLDYTKDNPTAIQNEIKYNLVFSILLWTQYARFVGVGDATDWMYKLPFKMIKNLSFKKGMEEYASIVYDKKNKIMWSALANPICLLLNELYYNNNSSFYNILCKICEEIMANGLKSDDIKEILDTPYEILLNGMSVRSFAKSDNDYMKQYVNKMSRFYPTLQNVFESASVTIEKLGDKDFEEYI